MRVCMSMTACLCLHVCAHACASYECVRRSACTAACVHDSMYARQHAYACLRRHACAFMLRACRVHACVRATHAMRAIHACVRTHVYTATRVHDSCVRVYDSMWLVCMRMCIHAWCMSMVVCLRAYACAHVCVHACVRATPRNVCGPRVRATACVHSSVCARQHVSMTECMRVNMCIHACVHVYGGMPVFACLCACVYMPVCMPMMVCLCLHACAHACVHVYRVVTTAHGTPLIPHSHRGAPGGGGGGVRALITSTPSPRDACDSMCAQQHVCTTACITTSKCHTRIS